MILGSHNSWSYLPPKHWWMWPVSFMAKCQSVDIRTQYEKYGVRCFDLRLAFNDYGNIVIRHGIVEYQYTEQFVYNDLMWLNNKGDVYVRVLLEARTKKQYTVADRKLFADVCYVFERQFQGIKFWCGRNLYNWNRDYEFSNYPTCDEKYASVCYPKLIDDWWPWLFSKINNGWIREEGTRKDILLIDFVNIR